MRVCKCGGIVTQHDLTDKEAKAREAWTCQSCSRYEIKEIDLTQNKLKKVLTNIKKRLECAPRA